MSGASKFISALDRMGIKLLRKMVDTIDFTGFHLGFDFQVFFPFILQRYESFTRTTFKPKLPVSLAGQIWLPECQSVESMPWLSRHAALSLRLATSALQCGPPLHQSMRYHSPRIAPLSTSWMLRGTLTGCCGPSAVEPSVPGAWTGEDANIMQ
eukprot:scaffold11351_cov18-Tisochrysis_lutea.AAC.1